MKLSRAREKANRLMQEHELEDWSFEFDNAKKRFGYCSYTDNTISLSEKLVEMNNEQEVEDVIRHEIAHALVGSGHGHDRAWKQKAEEVGADPSRCYDNSTVNTPDGNYIVKCPNGCFEREYFKKSKTVQCAMKDGNSPYYCRECEESLNKVVEIK